MIEKHQTNPFLCTHLYTPKERIDAHCIGLLIYILKTLKHVVPVNAGSSELCSHKLGFNFSLQSVKLESNLLWACGR